MLIFHTIGGLFFSSLHALIVILVLSQVCAAQSHGQRALVQHRPARQHRLLHTVPRYTGEKTGQVILQLFLTQPQITAEIQQAEALRRAPSVGAGSSQFSSYLLQGFFFLC